MICSRLASGFRRVWSTVPAIACHSRVCSWGWVRVSDIQTRIVLLLFAFLKDADVGKVTVVLVEIQAVADDKLVRDLESHVVRFHGHFTTRRLIEQRRYLHGPGLMLLQMLAQKGQCQAGIENVFHKD